MHSSSLKRPLAILVTLMLALALPQQSMLAEKDKKEGKREAPVVDEKTGKRLNEAIEFLNQQKYNEARNALSGLNLEKLSPYERSRVEQIFASVEHSQGNYDKARTHFKAAMDAGGLNEQEISQIRYVIAQLYIAEERWKEGAAALEDWFKTAKSPNSAAYYLLAAAYYQMGDYKRALVPATKAIEITDKPQESWLQLVVALYLQQENYTATIPVLQRLIALAPNKKIYWSQLSSIYGEKEDYPNSLVMLQIPYNAGLLTEDSELRRLADLLMVTGMP